MNTTDTMPTPKAIREHFKTNYNSSPRDVSTAEMRVIRKHDCTCDHCGKHIFELYDFPDIGKDELLCEECHREEYYQTCPICEDSYENPTSATDTFFVVSKECANDAGVQAGFYQVLKRPFFVAAVAFGFEFLIEENIKILRACDINSMLSKIYGRAVNKVNADTCCPDCVKKYTGQTKLRNNYCDKEYGKLHIALIKKVIKEGK